MYFDLVYGISVTQEKKPTANRHESALRASESDFLTLTFAIQLRCLAHPSSGPFGQILSAPLRLPMVNPIT